MKKVLRSPIASATGPASAMDTGISETLTKKSSEATRPSRCGGTRRCSSVPQMTMGKENIAPITKDAAMTTHTDSASPMTTKGSAPRPHPRFITVR